jgi:hypothetical protein
MMKNTMTNKRIEELKNEIAVLEKQVEAETLLEAVWNELGPYTPHLSTELRYKLQDFFKFDDSE